jgi:hypothetical protein
MYTVPYRTQYFLHQKVYFYVNFVAYCRIRIRFEKIQIRNTERFILKNWSQVDLKVHFLNYFKLYFSFTILFIIS